MNKWPVLLLMALAVTLSGCRPEPDREELRRQILDLHQKLIDAHLQKNPDYFTQGLADGFVSVKDGEILRPTAAEIAANMRNYINNTKFEEYRDLREPIIGFSQDGTVAWAIVQVKVRGERKREDGTVRPVDFVCAWLTLYERDGPQWKTLAEVSTFK